MTPTPTLRDQIRAALSEAGDNGVTLEDLERITGAPRKSGSPDFHVDSFLAMYSLRTDFRVERAS